ncbi:MAG: cytochrome c class I [Puniceicoccaceae bacterium 5H]|nr:MAG: cytochrome c class I [Puniceicoccaceae bacterium 5H]
MSDDIRKQYPPDGNPRETFEGNRFEDARMQRVHDQLMRERPEPSENFAPLPLALTVLVMFLCVWAGLYLAKYTFEFDPFHYNEDRAANAVADEGPKEVDMMALGKRTFSQNCVACHQQDGQGQPGVYPPLAGSEWVQGNPKRLIAIVLHGLAGEVHVNGETYNNAMTPFGRLRDQQIAAVLTYVRSTPDFGNESDPVTEDMVAEVRDETSDQSEQWSQDQLDELYPIDG